MKRLRSQADTLSRMSDSDLVSQPQEEIYSAHDLARDIVIADRYARLDKGIKDALALFTEYRREPARYKDTVAMILNKRGLALDQLLQSNPDMLTRFSGLDDRFGGAELTKKIRTSAPEFREGLSERDRNLEYMRAAMLAASIVFGAEKKESPFNTLVFAEKAELAKKMSVILMRYQDLKRQQS